ncbi:MAG: DUF1998 domain-containing protein [Acidobacteria bacterium]|nr:DUF1998 domain-containing protein [Acidobacteriota bacterium]
MATKKKKSIRAAQLVSPFGVGAVVEIGGESFACMDLNCWPAGACMRLPDSSLERMLGKEIRRPPSESSKSAVPFSRFPRWLFCPTCRRLYRYNWTKDSTNKFKQPTCDEPGCKGVALAPMRFVGVCEQGHLRDVDWYWWAHRNAQVSNTGQCSPTTSRQFFRTRGASGGDFNAMSISCTCKASSTFESLTERPFPLGCLGRQPWQSNNEAKECNAQVRIHPRAASNVYFPQSLSAIDIGSEVASASLEAEGGLRLWLDVYRPATSAREVARMWPAWRSTPTLYKHIVDEGCRKFALAHDVVGPIVVEFIGGTATARAPSPAPNADKSQHGILRTEWPHLARGTGIQTPSLRTRPIRLAKEWPAEFLRVWDQITLIDRLREVRALVGFRRLRPDTTSRLVEVDLGAGVNWIAGVEQFGEGVFLKFNESFISQWELRAFVSLASRMATLKEKCERWGREPASVYASPRFIALHTFAHGLIRRLAFDAGYSSSSLRERIYCDAGQHAMAGILVYTSDGDSEGSLGGLVRQGSPGRLLMTIRRALADLSWCSSDPVCSEQEKQGIDALNAAACHACCLLSETSCMFNNSLLDRRLLVGRDQVGIPGLLADTIGIG